MKTIVLKDSEWLRGEGSTRSVLYRPDDAKMCCMGVASVFFGVPVDQISGVGTLCDLEETPEELGFMFLKTGHMESDIGVKVYKTNDETDDYPSDEERVKELNVLVRPHGINFEFRKDE